jgi:hypothetical protein
MTQAVYLTLRLLVCFTVSLRRPLLPFELPGGCVRQHRTPDTLTAL